MYVIGLIGLGLIAIGFGYQMVETLKQRRCDMDRAVVGLFILAALFLFYYATILGDKIFMALNLLLAGINAVNFYYA